MPHHHELTGVCVDPLAGTRMPGPVCGLISAASEWIGLQTDSGPQLLKAGDVSASHRLLAQWISRQQSTGTPVPESVLHMASIVRALQLKPGGYQAIVKKVPAVHGAIEAVRQNYKNLDRR